MPCCGISLDYWRARLEAAEKERMGIGYKIACDLLFPEGAIKDTDNEEYEREEESSDGPL